MADAAPSSRRNGKMASCEPCRRGKIRCDHKVRTFQEVLLRPLADLSKKRPICGRCERRGQVSKCYYHPAPLTKPRGPAFGVTPNTPLTPAEYSGHTCLPVAFHSVDSIQGVIRADNESDVRRTQFQGRNVSRQRQLLEIAETLEQLQDLAVISQLVTEYTTEAQVALVPGGIMLRATSTLHQTAGVIATQQDGCTRDKLETFANAVLDCTTLDIHIPPDLDFKQFVDMFTGNNLRLEMIGLIYAIAARTRICNLPRGAEHSDPLLDPLFKCAQACLSLARELAPSTNDVTLWLSFEVTRLYSNAQGDTHPNVWRSIGDMSSDIYIMGINRESKVSANTPFWLAECRRRTWAVAYQWDKFGSRLFERPPRMLKRYSDCKLPLELTEQELLSDEATLSEARQKLTSDGWKREGVYCSATWSRMRFMASVLYETIMEFEYQIFDDKTVHNLLQLETQLQTTWSSFPDRLRYKPEVWHTKEHPAACLMLAILNLLYLQSKLLIHRLLTRANISYTGPTLEIASRILSTVNHLAQVRDRAVFLRHDNSYVMLCYGLPGAAVVVEAISKNGVNNLPAVVSRAKLIRDLSVFVSHLEGICQPGEANHRLCTRAARVISKTLDEVLDLNAGSTGSVNALAKPDEGNSAFSRPPPQPLSPSRSQSGRGSDDLALNPGYDAFNSLDQFDLDSWLKSVDWTGAGGEYTF